MIIDIRNNTGGSASNIFMLVRRFIQTETDLFNSRMKSGPGHGDFTGLTKTTIKPAEKTYKGKVCVLTNRKVFSAASIFTLSMREVPELPLLATQPEEVLACLLALNYLMNGKYIVLAVKH
jgi:C-terminal processing protease CtpA/Prc